MCFTLSITANDFLVQSNEIKVVLVCIQGLISSAVILHRVGGVGHDACMMYEHVMNIDITMQPLLYDLLILQQVV